MMEGLVHSAGTWRMRKSGKGRGIHVIRRRNRCSKTCKTKDFDIFEGRTFWAIGARGRMENEAGEVGRGKLWRAVRIMLRSLGSFQEEWETVGGFYIEKQHDQIDSVKKISLTSEGRRTRTLSIEGRIEWWLPRGFLFQSCHLPAMWPKIRGLTFWKPQFPHLWNGNNQFSSV